VTLLVYSGRPDPVFQLDSNEISALKLRIANLPSVGDPKWVDGLGYRGFMIAHEANSSLPDEIRVLRGVVRITTAGTAQYFTDAKGLEVWLTALGAQRGARIPGN
jgi:hypothetical protein